MRKILFLCGLTVLMAVSIVVVGRVVLLGYEALFDGITRAERTSRDNRTVSELANQAPTPTPRVGDDFVPDFTDESGYYELPYEEPLPDAIFITPLHMLDFDLFGSLELPVVGATGWVAAKTGLFRTPPGFYYDDEETYENGEEEADEEEEPLFVLFEPEPYEQDFDYGQEFLPFRELDEGQVFVILEEWYDWWRILLPDGETGWVKHSFCFINLPDVVPSIVFNITNATSSVKRSGVYEIPGVTGEALYSAFRFNHRFGRHMYIVPALYSTAKRLSSVQQTALENGETLVIYEVFRPHRTQQFIVNRVNDLIRSNPNVSDALNTPPWSPSWFISHGVSHHQRGAAIDATLARVVDYEIIYTADFVYSFRRITDYVTHKMPTPMHDLHPDAATFTAPGTREFADTMTESAKLMQGFFLLHGFTPLASEWWHFNDPYGVEIARSNYVTGDFMTEEILSFPPSFRE